MTEPRPRPRRITTTTVWVASPHNVLMCQCGHLHYARREYVDGQTMTNLAPQWRWCEDPECPCQGLRVLEDQ